MCCVFRPNSAIITMVHDDGMRVTDSLCFRFVPLLTHSLWDLRLLPHPCILASLCHSCHPIPFSLRDKEGLHRALFAEGGLKDGTKLGYYMKGQVRVSRWWIDASHIATVMVRLDEASQEPVLRNLYVSLCPLCHLRQLLLGGMKKGPGILCSCCKQIVSAAILADAGKPQCPSEHSAQ